MLKILRYNKKNSSRDLEKYLSKRKFVQKNLTSAVNKIIRDVQKNGDKAVLKYEKKFSKIKTKSSKILFTVKEINKIINKTDKKVKRSIDLAFKIGRAHV